MKIAFGACGIIFTILLGSDYYYNGHEEGFWSDRIIELSVITVLAALVTDAVFDRFDPKE